MSRKIFTLQTHDSENGETQIFENEVEMNDETTLISSDDMQKLFSMWDGNDLKININLKDKINEFLNYQEEMNALKDKFNTNLFDNFIIYSRDTGSTYERNENYYAALYINEKFITDILLFSVNHSCRGILLQDFKLILTILGNKNAIWIENDNNTIIDIITYIVSIGGKIEIEQYKDDEEDDDDFRKFNVKIEVDR